MAPRRIFASAPIARELTGLLATALRDLEPVQVPERTSNLLQELMFDAENLGARFELNGFAAATRVEGGGSLLYPTLVTQARAEMRIAQTDIFAPVLSILEVGDEEEAIAANHRCPYALTAAVFGPEKQARLLALRIPAGTILLNDIIVSTADPRASFGGRKRSGFGATRGREGLLEMTTVKTIQTQRAKDVRAYAPHTSHHFDFFSGYIRAAHGGGWRERWSGLRQFLGAMVKIRQ
jgi:aldehyde dehydrogenase (NAD+)